MVFSRSFAATLRTDQLRLPRSGTCELTGRSGAHEDSNLSPDSCAVLAALSIARRAHLIGIMVVAVDDERRREIHASCSARGVFADDDATTVTPLPFPLLLHFLTAHLPPSRALPLELPLLLPLRPRPLLRPLLAACWTAGAADASTVGDEAEASSCARDDSRPRGADRRRTRLLARGACVCLAVLHFFGSGAARCDLGADTPLTKYRSINAPSRRPPCPSELHFNCAESALPSPCARGGTAIAA